MDFSNQKFYALLIGLEQYIKWVAKRDAEFSAYLKKRDYTIQIQLRNQSMTKYLTFYEGIISSRSRHHAFPDVTLTIKDSEFAYKLLSPWREPSDQLEAMMNAYIQYTGNDEFVAHFSGLLSRLSFQGAEYGEKQKGQTKYTNSTHGNPVTVYVEKNKIIRIQPLEIEKDAKLAWNIRAKGQIFSPPLKVIPAPSSLAYKSLIYSKSRIETPLIRADFHPNGHRNYENRGKTGYKKISWEQAYEIIAHEITRINQKYGPGSIASAFYQPHHAGILNSEKGLHKRFFDLIGHTTINCGENNTGAAYWGAMHHWGNAATAGVPRLENTIEDALKNCEMMVFWDCDPELAHGNYKNMDSTIRRLWLKKNKVNFVHISPYYNNTAALLKGKWIAPKPGTSYALALSIAYIWIKEKLYDANYINQHTVDFPSWKEFVLGETDGKPKTPKWQEAITGVPPYLVRAVARQWAKHKTYLAAGGLGGPHGIEESSQTGIEWSRLMVLLASMQGLGKQGCNLGAMCVSAPLDHTLYFPSKELSKITRPGANPYTGSPESFGNPVLQSLPANKLPEALLLGSVKYRTEDCKSIQSQFAEHTYPAPGHSPIKMMYHAGSGFHTKQPNTQLYTKALQSSKLEFVVNQCTWMEGTAQYADIIIPSCTSFETWDIGEYGHTGTTNGEGFYNGNYRIFYLAQQCISPIAESKSNFEIYNGLAKKLGFSQQFSEGLSEFEWCRKIFEVSGLAEKVSWKKFLKTGHHILPPIGSIANGTYGDPAFRKFAQMKECTPKNPSTSKEIQDDNLAYCMDTQSRKIEFVSNSLKLYEKDSRERHKLTGNVPETWINNPDTLGFTLMIVPPRYSYHSLTDKEDSYTKNIEDHRIEISGKYYIPAKIHVTDAKKLGISNNDLVKIHNETGSIICAARLTNRLSAGNLLIESSTTILKQENLDIIPASTDAITPNRPTMNCTEIIQKNGLKVKLGKLDVNQK